MTINDATHKWVNEFNAIPQGMIKKLIENDIDSWHERTMPYYGDSVRLYEIPEKDKNENEYTGGENKGEIIDILQEYYLVRLYDGVEVLIKDRNFEVIRKSFLPIWGTMWSFKDLCDQRWIKETGIKSMSECGFRIYEHTEWGFFFGIDGAGYDFYEQHWIPLYHKRGLQWHSEKTDSF